MALDSYVVMSFSVSSMYGIWPNACFSRHAGSLMLLKSKVPNSKSGCQFTIAGDSTS